MCKRTAPQTLHTDRLAALKVTFFMAAASLALRRAVLVSTGTFGVTLAHFMVAASELVDAFEEVAKEGMVRYWQDTIVRRREVLSLSLSLLPQAGPAAELTQRSSHAQAVTMFGLGEILVKVFNKVYPTNQAQILSWMERGAHLFSCSCAASLSLIELLRVRSVSSLRARHRRQGRLGRSVHVALLQARHPRPLLPAGSGAVRKRLSPGPLLVHGDVGAGTDRRAAPARHAQRADLCGSRGTCPAACAGASLSLCSASVSAGLTCARALCRAQSTPVPPAAAASSPLPDGGFTFSQSMGDDRLFWCAPAFSPRL